jgi:hypothetical protein
MVLAGLSTDTVGMNNHSPCSDPSGNDQTSTPFSITIGKDLQDM